MPRLIPSTLPEQGRIRLGDMEPNAKGEGYHQHKLRNFRLTSADEAVLDQAAALYGGEVRVWDGPNAPRNEKKQPTQWELYTESNALQVVVPSLLALDISYEQWVRGARGCILRCTGEWITRAEDRGLVGAECQCPADDIERGALAKEGKACARILRLKVLLPELSGMGVWRLETKGYNATAELNGSLALLKAMGAPDLFRAVLRLEERTAKGEDAKGKATTFQFVVPVLKPTLTPLALIAAQERRMLPPAQARQAALTAAEDCYGESEHLETPTAHPAPAEPVADRREEEISTIIARIDAVVIANGGNLISFWARNCGAQVVDRPEHLTRSQLLALEEHVQKAAEERKVSEQVRARAQMIEPQPAEELRREALALTPEDDPDVTDEWMTAGAGYARDERDIDRDSRTREGEDDADSAPF